MNDPKQSLDPGEPLRYAPRRLREQNDQADAASAEHERIEPFWPARHRPHEDMVPLPHLLGGHDLRIQAQPDIFAEALARAEREQLERDLEELPAFFHPRPSRRIVAKVAIAVAAAALAALIYVVVAPQTFLEGDALSNLPTWQELRLALFEAPPRQPAPTLMVRDNNGSSNEPLELGVTVESPAPGMTVMIKRMPPDTRLTVGTRVSEGEWRVPARDVSGAAITPPTDFVGEMDLSAELRDADEARLVTAVVRLTWTAPPVSAAVVAAAPLTPASLAAAPPSPPQAATPALPARTEAIQELSPNEIAGLIRRAQEMLASGDLQAARAQLTRAAAARDPRAALLLAKTFDPAAFRQYNAADPGPDPEQARNWYRRAREWGSPEAQRLLDALASYPRK